MRSPDHPLSPSVAPYQTTAGLLEPVSVETFLRDYAGKNWLVVKGRRGKFSGLLRWSDLNRELEKLRVTSYRMRLVRRGKGIDPSVYLYSKNNIHGSQINSAAVTRLLNEGATLVLDNVDELFYPVRAIANDVEELFQTDVQANLYASWASEPGFGMHWDHHDALIVQVSGRKEWRVWGPARTRPLMGELMSDAMKPEGPPLWTGSLHDGDCLYLPRGWIHAAQPVGEPSLHITIGFYHPTGMDLIRWLAHELRDNRAVRADAPRYASDEEQGLWLQQIADVVTHSLGADAMKRFTAWLDSAARVRPSFRLPAVGHDGYEWVDSAQVWLANGRRIWAEAEPHEADIRFRVGEATFTCHRMLQDALHLLRSSRGVSVRELRDAVSPDMQSELLRCLKQMAAAGAIWAEDEPCDTGVEVPTSAC